MSVFVSNDEIKIFNNNNLICDWTNDWVNNREAGDLRRHLAHYDVTVMSSEMYLRVPLTIGYYWLK